MVKPLIISYYIFDVFLYAYVSGSEFSNQWLIKSDMDSNGLEKLAGKLGFRILTKLPTNHYVLSRDDVPKWSKHKATSHTKRLLKERTVRYVRQEVWETVGFKQSNSFHPTDPYWNLMWYMNGMSNNSLGILESWNSNYTGNGVKIAILDGGVEYKHMDLFNRYEKGVDLYDGDSDPSPPSSDSGHGTKCAGIALATTNTECIIGVAYNARLIAIRLFGPSRQALTSSKVKALTDTDVHVSSNSWGVLDNTIEYATPEITEALRYGVTNLRDGKGVIYVFAGGNGGSGDNCNLDTYVNSIYTIGINSVTKDQIYPGTAEPCTAVLTSTYTGNGLPRLDICSTSVGGKCVTDFKGTSASTPMAAGIIALGLEANPDLHWRDVQELIIRSSKTDDLKSGSFVVNGVGRKVSDVYGYGIINAKNFISMALTWKSLPAQHTCESDFRNDNMEIDETSFRRSVESVHFTDGCNFTRNCVNNLEHVEARVVFEYSLRGAIEIKLISPSGTVSNLLTYRGRDSARNGKFDWTYMSVHHWGEGVIGKWKLNVSIAAGEKEKGKLIGWKLILHGTGEGCTKEDEDEPPGVLEKEHKLEPWKTAVIIISVLFALMLVVIGSVIWIKREKKQRNSVNKDTKTKPEKPASESQNSDTSEKNLKPAVINDKNINCDGVPPSSTALPYENEKELSDNENTTTQIVSETYNIHTTKTTDVSMTTDEITTEIFKSSDTEPGSCKAAYLTALSITTGVISAVLLLETVAFILHCRRLKASMKRQ